MSKLPLSSSGRAQRDGSLGLVHYDAMVRAISVCRSVDEVKELRNKARALEMYAQQARNLDAERKCCEVRIRAERRAGELLREMKVSGQRQKQGDSGGNRKQTSRNQTSAAPAAKLADLNITRDQSSKWQQLAEVPEAEFERAVSGDGLRPTTDGILNGRKPREPDAAPRIDLDALWLWGRLREIEERGIMNRSLADLISVMTDSMRDDCHRIVPGLFRWLESEAKSERHRAA